MSTYLPVSLFAKPWEVLKVNNILKALEHDSNKSLFCGSTSINFSNLAIVLLIWRPWYSENILAASTNGLIALDFISKLSLFSPSCSTKNCLKKPTYLAQGTGHCFRINFTGECEALGEISRWERGSVRGFFFIFGNFCSGEHAPQGRNQFFLIFYWFLIQ